MSISLVIPTYEMSDYLPALWTSLEEAGLFEVVAEVVVVDDGSTDGTREVLERLGSGPHGELLVRVHLERNVGRFRARIEGARRARGTRVLFLDTRLTLPSGFGAALAKSAAIHPSVIGVVDIDVSRNVFCLYWDRSHRLIFKKTYDARTRPLTLTSENYDEYVKGTTVFLCERDLFLAASSTFDDLLSDDTFLLKAIVDKTPITIDPSVRVQWVPRETWSAFLGRLWERGPSFVEYHVFEHRGGFFWAVLGGGVLFISLFGAAIVNPLAGALTVSGALVATALSTALLAKTPSEFVRLAPLHSAVVTTFGAAVLRGLAVNLLRRRGQSARTGSARAS